MSPVPRRCVCALLSLAAPALPAAELADKLQIFGHLTQAYGESDRGSIQGATEAGTTDLRNIAIQFRWDISDSDTVVVQLAHERRGDDIFSPKDDEVEVDWAFYEKRWMEHSTLKVGRLNIPLGIYNEIRDVGTLLPFFNLPVSFYGGVLSSAETVDGISIAHTFAARSRWDLEAEIYYGGWDTFQQQIAPGTEFGLVNREARAEDGIGLQFWLNTPVPGLRLGAGTLTWLIEGPISTPGKKERWDSWHLSVDASTERWIARAEYRKWEFEQDFGLFFGLPVSIPGNAEREGFFLQFGAWVTPEIGIFGQHEETALGNDLEAFPRIDDFHRDTAVSFNYRFRPDLVARAEYHAAATRFPLGADVPPAIGPRDVSWVILGLSVSF